ncbi:hypothetical protein PYW07_012990 [Mythimna separata]|uniref:RING-type E3 ubiquitin transferase n=1 Tax=Mythimna separata TaxID=271217 RepID=A0AAD8DLT5_MYTSE|nr:hypothetical protein PYW07_012990 [Mythimna separata]
MFSSDEESSDADADLFEREFRVRDTAAEARTGATTRSSARADGLTTSPSPPRAGAITRSGRTVRTSPTTRAGPIPTNDQVSQLRRPYDQEEFSDRLSNQGGPTEELGPPLRLNDTDRLSPLQPEPVDQGSQTDISASPSILGHVAAGAFDNPDVPRQVDEPGHTPENQPVQRTGDQAGHNADADTTEINHIVHRRAAHDAFHILERLQPEPIVISEDSSHVVTSEESNQSLPEAYVPVLTESVEEPPAKIRKISSPDRTETKNEKLNKSDDLDGETCPICLDSWGNAGKHRLVALKCGHLFGAECVERWLKAQTSNNRTCPTCKSRASLKDLRCIYARRLVAVDNSEVTRLQKQMDILLAQKNRTELQLQTAKMTQRALAEQLEALKKTIRVTKQQTENKAWRFALEKNLELCKDGGCRVLTYNCRTYELYVSQKSTNYLFPGYGIRKISCVDYTPGAFVPLHPKQIRDLAYSQPSDLLLSVALDSTARILQRGMVNVSVNAGIPLWSCAWNINNPDQFYVGGVGGVINLYDFRNPSTYVRSLAGLSGDMSPVVSLCSTEYGLLSCQLNSCCLWESEGGHWKQKSFPVTGAFMSMCYDSESQKALVSMRPKGSERSKLTLCSLKPSLSGGCEIDVDQVINGSARSSVISRATFCKTQGASWVAAHSESDSTLYLHGLDGSRTMSLPAAEPALDVCSIQVNGTSVLAALSESRLRLYKAHTLGN